MHFIYWGREWISCYLFNIVSCVHTLDVNLFSHVCCNYIHLFVSVQCQPSNVCYHHGHTASKGEFLKNYCFCCLLNYTSLVYYCPNKCLELDIPLHLILAPKEYPMTTCSYFREGMLLSCLCIVMLIDCMHATAWIKQTMNASTTMPCHPRFCMNK
uniref:Putative secreted protein n=1 Tax=Ixodes ricinus TaxID=34613 RepID=A0A6B0UWV0_IXORI